MLKIVDDRLRMRTFIVGDNLTLADISLCCSISRAFSLVISPEIRRKFSSLSRWFTYVRSLPPFVEHLGTVNLCEQGYQPDFTAGSKK